MMHQRPAAIRRADERITVQDENGEIFHDPPPAEDLGQRL